MTTDKEEESIMITNEDLEILYITIPIMSEEGVTVPHDAEGYVLSSAFMRVLDVSGAEGSSSHRYYTLEQIETAVVQFCHDCEYNRQDRIFGGVVLMLKAKYPDRMRRIMSHLWRMAEDMPMGRAEWEWEKMLIRGEAAKRRMR